MVNQETLKAAIASGHYGVAETYNLRWYQPYPQRVWERDCEAVLEWKTYVECLDCGAIHTYSNPELFREWSLGHLEGHPKEA